jgi:AraC-like DNA-binding protein
VSTAVNQRDGTVESYEQILGQFRAWVGLSRNRQARDLKLDDFCSEFGYSRRTVQRVLTGYGTSFRKMLLQVRMAEAARLLRETDLEVPTISVKVGYTNVDHFVKVFKRECRILPAIYRKQSRDA